MRVGEGTGRPGGSGTITKATVRVPDLGWEMTAVVRYGDPGHSVKVKPMERAGGHLRGSSQGVNFSGKKGDASGNASVLPMAYRFGIKKRGL